MVGHPAHHTPSSTAKHRPPQKRKRGILIAASIGGAALIAAIGAWIALSPSSPPGLPSGAADTFFAQMQQAAAGKPIVTSVFQGSLRTERKGGVTLVTAENVPPSLCVSVGWKLVRRGVLTINGVTPMRVSAARLAELCNQGESATLLWAPRPPE
ncbi:hypothetical protein [Magnetospirillum molischianum]|uniref:Uncharacterized protein n=1 Tax=Magnetospirillum molischianum DSM 120 TaxID=1150626 RepID=H8FRI0_MAGML|nr:hypothetical protein [Magnetospirillum molischianum]CCG40968.1 conserved exported hypothetical protein [Magnetospirillum molischianum DSM 120]